MVSISGQTVKRTADSATLKKIEIRTARFRKPRRTRIKEVNSEEFEAFGGRYWVRTRLYVVFALLILGRYGDTTYINAGFNAQLA
tara:strand:- start:3986 stop:4240 length:255 start_codon:yes stop_codon:yes gene_type:complete